MRILCKNNEPAIYPIIFLASECLEKVIKLYRGTVDSKPEIFKNDHGPRDINNPIEILFTGSFELGHF